MSAGNGGRFIERLIAASPTARRKFTVLEQDIYVKPLTRKALADAMPKDDVKRDPDYVGLFLIVQCAEAEDGSKLFSVRDIDGLREAVSLELLQKIEAGIMGVITPNAEQIDKDVKADPLSASASA